MKFYKNSVVRPQRKYEYYIRFFDGKPCFRFLFVHVRPNNGRNIYTYYTFNRRLTFSNEEV